MIAKQHQRRAQAQASTDGAATNGADQTAGALLDDYMDTAQLAAELGVIPLTIVRWRVAKTGPPVTRIGRRLYYRRSSVRAWMAEQEQGWA
jgi:hypothetical protein